MYSQKGEILGTDVCPTVTLVIRLVCTELIDPFSQLRLIPLDKRESPTGVGEVQYLCWLYLATHFLWIDSLLSNQQQCVVVDGKKSSCLPVL